MAQLRPPPLGRLRRQCGGAERRDVAGVGLRAAVEHGRARNEHVGAGADDQRGGLVGNSAVDLDVDRRAPISRLTLEIFSTIAGMNFWPPNPGLTVITITRSSHSST